MIYPDLKNTNYFDYNKNDIVWIDNRLAAIKAHNAASLDQDSFRFRTDGGSESAASWVALINVDITGGPGEDVEADTNFRIRFLIKDTNTGAENNVALQLQYNLNSDSWNDVNASSSVIRSFASTQFADGDDTTQQLGSGTFITPNSGMDEVEGLAGGGDIDFVDLTADEVEVEYCIQIRSADVINTDTIDLRVIRGSTTVLENYTEMPRIDINSFSSTVTSDALIMSESMTVNDGELSMLEPAILKSETQAGALGQIQMQGVSELLSQSLINTDANISISASVILSAESLLAAIGSIQILGESEFHSESLLITNSQMTMNGIISILAESLLDSDAAVDMIGSSILQLDSMISAGGIKKVVSGIQIFAASLLSGLDNTTIRSVSSLLASSQVDISSQISMQGASILKSESLVKLLSQISISGIAEIKGKGLLIIGSSVTSPTPSVSAGNHIILVNVLNEVLILST